MSWTKRPPSGRKRLHGRPAIGLWMLRRELGDKVEFLMFTLWESLDAVKGFAGEDHERAVFYPEDDRFLVERDEESHHFEVVGHAPDPGGA